jgi:plasmid stabilization system protein ParE
MNKTIRLTKVAENSLDEIICYTNKQWTDVELKRLKKRIKELFNVIQSDPYAFKIYDSETQIRKAILLSDISVFYKINDSTIAILLFWHNSRNPENLQF